MLLITQLQKTSNKVSELNLRSINFKEANHWMLAHILKQKKATKGKR